LAALLAASATAYTAVKLLGAAYLGFLGVQALWQSRNSRVVTAVGNAPSPAGNPWRTGLVSNVFNPKIAVFYTGLLPTLAPSGFSPHLGMALLVLIHATLTLVWLGSYVLLLATARAFFERPAVRRALDRITGVVLIGFGIKVATSQP
jgi:threonine/homoserine/homoserine lactone efflux protein